LKILIYLGHPAQYHFFKNIIKAFQSKKIEVQILIKSKDVLENLLKNDGIDYINILPEGRKSSTLGIILGLIKRDIRFFKIVRKNKPDIMIGSDPSVSHVGKVLGIPVLTVDEDDAHVISRYARLTYPFTNWIVAPDSCDCGKWNSKKLSYSGFMKLAYLHPNYFTKPTRIKNDNIFLIRLSKLDAFHDLGIKGFTKEILMQVVNKLLHFGSVKISSEGDIDEQFREYMLNINPNEMHYHLSQATLLISDSQSMSMEAAMLGVPSIRFSSFAGKIGVLEELEIKYGLTFGIKPEEPEKLLNKLDELLNIDNLQDVFELRKKRMLKDKIDVTAFFVWLIENYPKSVVEIKSDPKLQYQFK
jgi:predicted glycosyltransferase